jgi:Rps23 Pro-64 3,4-dihydroxylase Tpa1-like proline 4-hydroxylase
MSAESSKTGCFFPFRTYSQWLDPDTADALLDYAIENEAHFNPGTVLYRGVSKTDPNIRNVIRTRKLGSFRALLTDRVQEIKPELERAFGIKPFTLGQIETELVAYGDGAHFSRHIDTLVVANQAPTARVLTLVYYFHRRPAGFMGGALRFYALRGSQVQDVAPDHNVLAAFPSIAPHSVERVDCPSGQFADSRFAALIWVHSQ